FALSFDGLTYEHRVEVMDFVRARVEKMMPAKTPKDIREAVLASTNLIVPEMREKVDALVVDRQSEGYKAAVERLSRDCDQVKKDPTGVSVDASLFENDDEKALDKATQDLTLSGTASDKLAQLFALSPVIDKFFNNTMVMVDNEAV